MNNKFNTRFSSLIQDKDNNKIKNNNINKNNNKLQDLPIDENREKPNIFKNSEFNSNSKNNYFINKKNFFNEMNKKEEEKRLQQEKERKIEIEKSLSNIENFPELVSMKKIDNQCEQNYIEKLNKVKVEEKVIEDEYILKQGWISITYNKKTNTPIYNYEKIKNIKNQENQELFYDVVEVLTNKYYLWRDEYINNWCEDDYIKMYISSNSHYDNDCENNYNYFENSDEEYDNDY
jgi:hypothetical protein